MVLVDSQPSGVAAVTLAEAKAHIRVDIPDEDPLIDAMLVAATVYVEKQAGTFFVRRNATLKLDHAPTDTVLELPGGKNNNVDGVAIEYIDANGATQIWSGSNYQVDYDSVPGRISPNPDKTWPSVGEGYINSFSVTYTPGIAADVTEVPKLAKQAVLLVVDHWYRNRGMFTAGIVAHDVAASVNALTTLIWSGALYYRGTRKTIQETLT